VKPAKSNTTPISTGFIRRSCRIERGGAARPLLLDYELKRNLNHDLALLGPEKTISTAKAKVAEKHGLQLVDGKIPVPICVSSMKPPNWNCAMWT